jgi:hypothetical protein
MAFAFTELLQWTVIDVAMCGCLAADGVNGNWSAQTRKNSVRSINRDTNTRKTLEPTCKDVHVCMQSCASNGGSLALVLASHCQYQIPYFIYVNFHASFAFGHCR